MLNGIARNSVNWYFLLAADPRRFVGIHDPSLISVNTKRSVISRRRAARVSSDNLIAIAKRTLPTTVFPLLLGETNKSGQKECINAAANNTNPRRYLLEEWLDRASMRTEIS